MKRALFIGSITEVFAGQLALELKKCGYEVDALVGHRNTQFYAGLNACFANVYNPFTSDPNASRGRLSILKLLKFVLFDFYFASRRFDVVHFHYATNPVGMLLSLLLWGRFKKMLTFYGSDLYRASRIQKIFLNLTLPRYDVITFANQKTKEDFLSERFYFKRLRAKLIICRFGLRVLEVLKENLATQLRRLRSEPYLVAIGYNGDPAQRHREVIEALAHLSESQKAKMRVLLQLTYGLPSKKYRDDLIAALKAAKLEYSVVENYLSHQEMAQLRMKTDIMIQVQDTDQLSGSMQEILYLNTIVITGAWLPYEVLRDRGVDFLAVESIASVCETMQTVLDHFSQFEQRMAKNSMAIEQLSSWEACRPLWIAAYEQ